MGGELDFFSEAMFLQIRQSAIVRGRSERAGHMVVGQVARIARYRSAVRLTFAGALIYQSWESPSCALQSNETFLDLPLDPGWRHVKKDGGIDQFEHSNGARLNILEFMPTP